MKSHGDNCAEIASASGTTDPGFGGCPGVGSGGFREFNGTEGGLFSVREAMRGSTCSFTRTGFGTAALRLEIVGTGAFFVIGGLGGSGCFTGLTTCLGGFAGGSELAEE